MQLIPEAAEAGDARMTTEQLNELADALVVLSSKSSVLKERDELRFVDREARRSHAVTCKRWGRGGH